MRAFVLTLCSLFSTIAMAEEPSVENATTSVLVAAPAEFDPLAIQYELKTLLTFNELSLGAEYRFTEHIGVYGGVNAAMILAPSPFESLQVDYTLVYPELGVFGLIGTDGNYLEAGISTYFAEPAPKVTLAYRHESKNSPILFRAGLETFAKYTPSLMVGMGHRF